MPSDSGQTKQEHLTLGHMNAFLLSAPPDAMKCLPSLAPKQPGIPRSCSMEVAIRLNSATEFGSAMNSSLSEWVMAQVNWSRMWVTDETPSPNVFTAMTTLETQASSHFKFFWRIWRENVSAPMAPSTLNFEIEFTIWAILDQKTKIENNTIGWFWIVFFAIFWTIWQSICRK